MHRRAHTTAKQTTPAIAAGTSANAIVVAAMQVNRDPRKRR